MINPNNMTLKDVKALISDGESQTVELKKSLAQLKAALQTLCGFLNTSGGHVIIGVHQHGKIIGQDVSDHTQQEIAKSIAKVEPFCASITVQYVSIEAQNKQIIIISTKQGEHRPYAFDGRAYIRNQSTTMRMPQSRYTQCLLEREAQYQPSWEMKLVDANIDELDHEEIQRTIKIAVNSERVSSDALNEPIEDILMRLELMRDHKLTNAAMVLFAKSVQPHFSQCMIKMARFRGTSECDEFIDNQIIYGHAFHIMKEANIFLMRHLPVESFFNEDKLERIDKPLLPVLAIREALSNALCHRDYALYNGSLTLAIFDDRMEIWNNGMLPDALSLIDLKRKHKSHPRNQNIARVFYLRRYIETWGTGTTKMIKLSKDHGVPSPVFDEYSGGFSVVFPFNKNIGVNGTSNGRQKKYSLTDRQETLLHMIKEQKALGLNDMKSSLKNPPSERMIRKDLDTLRQHGLVRLDGHGKSAKWGLQP